MRRLPVRALVAALATFTWPCVQGEDPKDRPAVKVEYWKDIHPVLDALCARCHGGGNSKGGFRIDSRETVLAGGKSGPAAVSGKASSSLLIELVTSPDSKRAMPRAGRRLTPDEVDLLRAWIDAGLPWGPAPKGARGYSPRVREADIAPRRPEVPAAGSGRQGANPVDLFVDDYFRRQGITPPPPVSDALLVRRTWLDAIGLLPSPAEIAVYQADRSPEKRQTLVRRILARRRDYAEHWLTFWNDLLRNDYQGTGYIDGGRRQISGWLYRALATRLPYDKLVALAPGEEAAGFIGGIVWRGVTNASQTPSMQAAQSVSQVFLGVNLKCASCHDSFVSDWKLREAYGLACVFADGPLDVVRCDAPTGDTAKAAFLYPKLGEIDSSLPRAERLRRLAGIVTSREDGRLPRTIVNRLWAKLLGRGLVEPLDEMDAPAWHRDLLDWLAEDLVDHGWDLGWTLERILTSSAYSMPSVARGEREEGEYVFRGPEVRRLGAEQLLDAIASVTGVGRAWPDAAVDFGCLAGSIDPKAIPGLEHRPRWIGAGKAPAGEKAALRRSFTLEFDPEAAGAVASAGGKFHVKLNGKDLVSGAGPPVLADALPALHRGENTIEATAAEGPVAPGFLFFLRARGGGAKVDVMSGEGWTDGHGPAALRGRFDAAPADTSSRAAAHISVAADAGRFRASLCRSDPLLTALGRPNREQVMTRRASTATTLEALEVSNGSTLAGLLRRGARNILPGGEVSGREVIEGVFGRALGRKPDPAELSEALALTGDPPSVEGVEDLLWCVVLLPEMQLIR